MNFSCHGNMRRMIFAAQIQHGGESFSSNETQLT